MTISTIGIVGSGNPGTRIGLQAAISGFNVSVYEIDSNTLKKSQNKMKELVDPLSDAHIPLMFSDLY